MATEEAAYIDLVNPLFRRLVTTRVSFRRPLRLLVFDRAGFQYPGGPDDLASHASSNGADHQLVDPLKGLDKQQFDGPNAVMAKLSEAGVLGGSNN